MRKVGCHWLVPATFYVAPFYVTQDALPPSSRRGRIGGMDLETVIAIVVLVSVIGYGILSHRSDPDFWTAEAIRQQSRVTRRLICFVPSVACIFLFAGLALTRGPEDGLSAIFFSLVAYLARPDWLRRKSAVKSAAENPDAKPVSN